MTCRDEILRAFNGLSLRTGRDVFSPAEIVSEMQRTGTTYAESTIRTHVVSRMCADAPDHHAVVYQDLERVGSGLYKVRSTANEPRSHFGSNPDSVEDGMNRAPPIDRDPTHRPGLTPLPGTLVTADELTSLGFTALDLRIHRVDVGVASGTGAEWDTIGNVPKSPGIYAFTVEDHESMHVTYVGLTKHLWMVTKGRLPNGSGRGGQRYGRPKHAGVTRERINVLAARQIRAGHTVKHWVRPQSIGKNEDLRAQLRSSEEDLIVQWNLRTVGWNRG